MLDTGGDWLKRRKNMSNLNRPYRWLKWEEDLLREKRCHLTIAELLKLINDRRLAEGLPPRASKSLSAWSASRRIPLVYWRDDAYTALELSRLLGCCRSCIYRPCEQGLLEFRRGDRRSRLITLDQLANCLRQYPEVAATWPHRTIDRLSDLLEDPKLIDQIKSCRRLYRVKHWDGREWNSIQGAVRELRVTKETLRNWAELPSPPITIGV